MYAEGERDGVLVGGQNAERVRRWVSWVVGAVDARGGVLEDEKPVMDQRTMQCSLAALERIRSPCQATLVGG